MKISIRTGIFETNSSMSHSLVIGTQKEFNEWKNGELFWLERKGFVTPEEKERMINDKNSWHYEEEFWSEKDFVSNRDEWDMECFDGSFTSPSGDEVVWLARCGR